MKAKPSSTFFTVCFFLAIVVYLSGCKSSQPLVDDSTRMPASFEGRTDSISSATTRWKEYFSDPLLLDLIEVALENNYDILTAFQRIEMARSDVRLSKGALLPAISGVGAAAQRKFGLYTMDGAGNITTPIEGEELVPIHLPDYYVGLQTSWEVDIWGKLKNRKAAALSRYLASVEGRNFTVTNLVAEIASAYYELLSLDMQLEIIRETIVLQENAFRTVTAQMEAGRANALAVKQVEAQYVSSQTLELEINQRILETENRLNFLMGRYPQPIQREKWSFPVSVPVNLKVGIPSDLLRNRPDVKQAEFEMLAAGADVRAARAAFYPSFNITGAYGFQAFKTAYLFTTPQSAAYTLLGSLTAPLINRSAIKADFMMATAAQVEALYNYQKTVLNGYIEVYNELLDIQNLERVFTLKNREAELLDESIDISSELFRTGRANYLEIIVTQQNALQTKLELVDIKRNQFDSTIDLYKALGGGWQ